MKKKEKSLIFYGISVSVERKIFFSFDFRFENQGKISIGLLELAELSV